VSIKLSIPVATGVMMPPKKKLHPSDSAVQRAAELEIVAAVAKKLRRQLNAKPVIDQVVALDGFADGRKPICVEAWAHQGQAKGSQPHKVMRDMCKLLLVEKLLGKKCRKIFAVCDESAIAFLKKSWQGRFATEYSIETIVVEVSAAARRRILAAQKLQYK
jgi:hypothetical protein